jgi:putative hydrolase of the HAD superfamily
MNIKTVVFDFGNVLGFFSHRRAAEQLARHASGTTAEDILTYLIDSELEVAFELGLVSSEEVLDRLRKQFSFRASDEELALAAADMFTPNEPVCALVPRLRPRYRLLLLSNTNDIHYRHFRRQFTATLEHFDALIASHLVGLRKPDPRIYDHARELAGCSAAECLFIDDLPANIEAARACGWHGVLYHPGADLPRLLQEFGISVAA